MPHRQFRRHITIAPMARPASPHRERGLEMLRGGATAAQVATELGVMIVSSPDDERDSSLTSVQPCVPNPADYSPGCVEAGADVDGLLVCWGVAGRFGCWRRTVSGDGSRRMSESLCPVRNNLRRRGGGPLPLEVATDGLSATERRTEREGSLEDVQGLALVEGKGPAAGLLFRPQPEQQVVGQHIERGLVAGRTLGIHNQRAALPMAEGRTGTARPAAASVVRERPSAKGHIPLAKDPVGIGGARRTG